MERCGIHRLFWVLSGWVTGVQDYLYQWPRGPRESHALWHVGKARSYCADLQWPSLPSQVHNLCLFSKVFMTKRELFFSLRWNVSEFSSCSKSCGGGIQTRSVTCIQEVRHGGNNILRVDDSFCPQPPPITQQFCSVVDCPVMWKTGPWSKVRTHQNLICYYFLMSTILFFTVLQKMRRRIQSSRRHLSAIFGFRRIDQ